MILVADLTGRYRGEDWNAEYEPDPRDLVRELREALGMFAGALPYSPKQAWEEAIADVRRIRQDGTLRHALTEALEALRLTVEYVGLQTLRPFPGWSWFDVLSKYPEYADWLDSMVNPKPVVIDPSEYATCDLNDGSTSERGSS